VFSTSNARVDSVQPGIKIASTQNHNVVMKIMLMNLLFIGVTWNGRPAESATNAPPTPQPVGQRVVQDLTKWDVNQNGKLDPDELEKLRRDRIREHQARLQAQAQAAVEMRKHEEAARRARFMTPAQRQQYDANTNGIIESVEWEACRADAARRLAELKAARLAPGATNAVPKVTGPAAPSL